MARDEVPRVGGRCSERRPAGLDNDDVVASAGEGHRHRPADYAAADDDHAGPGR